MNTSVNTDDVIFNFFKQICDEKDDQKCVELGKEWINAMETNLSNMVSIRGFTVQLKIWFHINSHLFGCTLH